jgi:hypothetical protein
MLKFYIRSPICLLGRDKFRLPFILFSASACSRHVCFAPRSKTIYFLLPHVSSFLASLPLSFNCALKMNASIETLVATYKTARCNYPELDPMNFSTVGTTYLTYILPSFSLFSLCQSRVGSVGLIRTMSLAICRRACMYIQPSFSLFSLCQSRVGSVGLIRTMSLAICRRAYMYIEPAVSL